MAKTNARGTNLGIEAVRRLARRYGVQPSKLLSQNFLIDQSVVETSIDAAALAEGDRVIEVGAGFGVLTKALIATGARVMAFEIDRRLAAALHDLLGKQKNFSLMPEDFFHWFRGHTPLLAAHPYRIVANLPYNVSSFFFQTVLTSPYPPSSIVVLIQKELAERITAVPGQMSLLALSVQLYGVPTILRMVPRSAFWPQPEVDSSLLAIDSIHQPKHSTAALFRLARMAFAGKRKQLHNSLATGLHTTPDLLRPFFSAAQIPSTIRPQELTLVQWRALAAAIETAGLLESPAKLEKKKKRNR